MATPRACVIGWPVGHSRSPLIHRFWLQRYGIEGDYERAAVQPADLSTFMRDLGKNGYSGGNVTLPHKEAALLNCDVVTDLARRVGAVNTIWREGERLVGDNTDVFGFLANLDEQASGWDSGCDRAVVLGAGGAARAVLAGLVERGVGSVTILNRSVERAQRLADDASSWGKTAFEAAPLDAHSSLRRARLLVNTTSLGMTGSATLELDVGDLPDDAIVSDIIYAPLETRLIAAARTRGLRTCPGLGMLLHQAAPGFERWFGVKPEVTPELYRLVEEDIARGQR